MMFKRLKDFGLRINVDKCQFGQQEFECLGHTINAHSILPTTERVRAVTSYPRPETVHDLRRFLGLINFHRRSIPHAAQVLEPLHCYLVNSKKNDKTEVVWTPVSLTASVEQKAPCEGFLTESWRPLAFFSRKLTSAQCAYSTNDHELMAIYEAIRYFRHFLEGREFRIVTDHKPLANSVLVKYNFANGKYSVSQTTF